MQLPQWLARFNRHVTNPIQRLWAGWVPTMGILQHVGRKSGNPYRTPVTVFSTEDGVAILLTYDSISGEREQGTLQLTFANAVPRARYLVAKLVGTWLGLSVPLLVPLLVGMLVVIVAGVPFDGGHWARLAVLLLAGGLYFTFFVAFGLAISTLV